MFTKLAKEAREKAKKLEGRDNISSIIQKKYLEDLAKELEHQLNADFVNLKKNIEQDMTQVSESVIDCVREFEESVGMPISNSWLNVPVDAVEAVQSGKLYAGNWTLSSRIWGMEKKVMKDINTVIAEGIAANKSAYDIAKDLEKYVDPKAKKDWNWSKVYPGTNRKVDYSAQRLARTMVSHAYQFSFVESTKDNPFITKYKWISSHDKRVCPICKERDGKLFDKDKLPLDHPNGRCTFVSVFNKSATQISDEMAAWVKGKEGDFPKIDEYMKKKFGTDRYDKAMQMAMQGMKLKDVKEDIDIEDKLRIEAERAQKEFDEIAAEMNKEMMEIIASGGDVQKIVDMNIRFGPKLNAAKEKMDKSKQAFSDFSMRKGGHLTKEDFISSLPDEFLNKYNYEYEVKNKEAISGILGKWCAEGYEEMKENAFLEALIKNSDRKFNGKELFRGMSISDDLLNELDVGAEFAQKGLSSWSTNVVSALEFATNNKKPVIFIDKTKGEREAISIKAFSGRPWEDEVLYSGKVDFVVLKKKKELFKYKDRNGINKEREVHIIEVERK